MLAWTMKGNSKRCAQKAKFCAKYSPGTAYCPPSRMTKILAARQHALDESRNPALKVNAVVFGRVDGREEGLPLGDGQFFGQGGVQFVFPPAELRLFKLVASRPEAGELFF